VYVVQHKDEITHSGLFLRMILRTTGGLQIGVLDVAALIVLFLVNASFKLLLCNLTFLIDFLNVDSELV
jgi:hypothetical protein